MLINGEVSALDNYAVDNRTKEIQKYGLKILSVFHEICEENKLRYILDYGTLLGAVRHEGFIPWDDDVDVAMPRKDFEKFKEIASESLPGNMFLQTHETDTNYYLPLAKIRMKDNSFKEKQLAHFDITHGPWIDIFVYDYRFENLQLEEKKLKEFKEKRRFYDYITPNVKSNDAPNQNAMKTAIKKLVISLLKKSQSKKNRGIVMKNLDKRYEALNKVIKNVPIQNKAGELATYSFAVSESNPEQRITLNINDFNHRKLQKFENEAFYIPISYDFILKNRYNNYRELPPLDERQSNHQWI